MKKKLYVDDIRSPKDDSWHIARTITDAISAIDIFDFEVISLDHDISHQVEMLGMSRPYPCNENYTAVAHFIKEKYQKQLMAHEMQEATGARLTCLGSDCPERMGGECRLTQLPKIIIHTANPAGAVRLASILKDFEVTRLESYPANRLETIL